MSEHHPPAAVRARARHDTEARLGPARALHFDDGHPSLGIPPFVRAGSAVRRWGRRLVVAQDDVNALALLDEAAGTLVPLALPPGADGGRVFSEAQGNKALKLDLEACVALPDGRLVALGSGSTPARERVIVVSTSGTVRVVEARELYRGLRERVDFSGSELNVEGAVVRGEALMLFQRGNGAPRADLVPVNAVGEWELEAFLRWLDGGAAPTLRAVHPVELGAHGAVPYGFTDACVMSDGRVAFLAGAEDSPDTYRDGEVVGARFGVLDGSEAWTVEVVDEHGQPTRQKLEGIELLSEEAGTWRFVVVTDMDSPDRPSTLHELVVEGAGCVQ